MQPGLHLAFEPPFIQTAPRGDSVLLAALAMLEDLANEWGVPPLSQYLDTRSDMSGVRSDWHRVEDGLRSVLTLLHSPVCEEPALQTELWTWQRQLESAQQQGVKLFRIDVSPVDPHSPTDEWVYP